MRNIFLAVGFSAVGSPERNINLKRVSSFESNSNSKSRPGCRGKWRGWGWGTYNAMVRMGAKMAQYCARRAPLEISPLVDGDTTTHQQTFIMYPSGTGVGTYDTRSKDPNEGRFHQSMEGVGKSTIDLWYMVYPLVGVTICIGTGPISSLPTCQPTTLPCTYTAGSWFDSWEVRLGTHLLDIRDRFPEESNHKQDNTGDIPSSPE